MLIFEPPVFPIGKPSWVLIESIRIINDLIIQNEQTHAYDSTGDSGYVMKSRLQRELFERKIITTKVYANGDRNKASGEQMALRQKILNPLEDKGMVKLTKKARSKKVYLTVSGKRIANIFKYYNPKI